MRKYSILCLCITMVFAILTACNNSKNKDEVSFVATVLEINESSLLVEPVEGSNELGSADKIIVSIAKETLLETQDQEITVEDIEVGDKVEIFYDGSIAESYPAQIHKCYKIELLDSSSK